jgi:PAS domain S-box-containing protein
MMKAYRRSLSRLRLRSPAITFLLLISLIAIAGVGIASFIEGGQSSRSLVQSQLQRQIALVNKAAVLVRDLALAEAERSGIRRKIAKTASEISAASESTQGDLSFDNQVRVFVARLQSLSRGEEARLPVGDPRLKGVISAAQGPLGAALEQRDLAAQQMVVAVRDRGRKQMMLLMTLMLGLAAITGVVLTGQPRPRITPTPETDDTGSGQISDTDSTDTLMSALEGLDQGVAVFDAGDHLIFYTPRLAQLFSNILQPIEGQTYEQFVRDTLEAREGDVFAEEADDPGSSTAENLDDQLSQRLAQPHGSTNTDFLPDGRCLEISEYKTRQGGRIVLARDITEAEHREAVRTLSDARTTAIVDTVFDGIIMINDEGTVETYNPAAEKIFGFPASEVIGQNVSLLMPEGHAGSHDSYLRRYLSGGTPRVIGTITELQGKRQSGQLFPLEIAVNEVDATWILQERRRTPRRVFIATVRDITEQKELARQLQQSQKMEAIGTLAGGIAHDFNNILSVILGFTGLTLDDGQINDDGRENLDTVLEAANRARDLVQQILTFSRKGDQEKLRVGLQSVLEDALKMLRSTFPANVEMRVDIDPRELVVMADPTQMHQILMNLCTNAGQAMPGGGILEVKLQQVQIDGRTLESLGMQGKGNCARLMVRDTGVGMDAATMERVFEPFYTTKPLGVGTGLGLSVVHGIIHEHGGHIAVESSPGAGTTFTVLLPLAEPGEVRLETIKSETPNGQGRILFVDDEAAVRRMAEKLLLRLGYELVEQARSIDALRLFREQPDAFDLVVTDYSMPDMTGDVLASELRRIRPDIPIIICTGYSATFTPEVARDAGIEGYILKPAMAEELGRMVHEVLEKKRSL